MCCRVLLRFQQLLQKQQEAIESTYALNPVAKSKHLQAMGSDGSVKR